MCRVQSSEIWSTNAMMSCQVWHNGCRSKLQDHIQIFSKSRWNKWNCDTAVTARTCRTLGQEDRGSNPRPRKFSVRFIIRLRSSRVFTAQVNIYVWRGTYFIGCVHTLHHCLNNAHNITIIDLRRLHSLWQRLMFVGGSILCWCSCTLMEADKISMRN